MSITQTRNVDYVLVGKNFGGGTTPPANSVTDLADGQIGVFNAYNTSGAVGADASFVIAIGGPNGKAKFVSEAISPAKVEVSKARGLEVAVEQSDSIGFNGTAGSIAASDLVANNLYMVDVLVQEYLTSNTDGRTIKHFQYQSGASTPNSDDVTHYMTKSAIENFSREAEDYISFQHLINDAGAAVTGTATNLVWTKGSKTVVGDAVNTTITNVVAGTYISVATATTTARYKVASFTQATATTKAAITLEYAFQEATTTVARATNVMITAVLADAADTGILMTGNPLSFLVGKKQYKKVRWELTLNGFDTTASVREATAFEGLGTYEQAAEAEWFARGFEGEYHRMGEPVIFSSDFYADSTITYDVTTIRWVEDSNLTGLGANPASPKQITIYSPNGIDYMTDAAASNGVWQNIEAAMVNNTGKMSHRDTGAASDTAGSLLL